MFNPPKSWLTVWKLLVHVYFALFCLTEPFNNKHNSGQSIVIYVSSNYIYLNIFLSKYRYQILAYELISSLVRIKDYSMSQVSNKEVICKTVWISKLLKMEDEETFSQMVLNWHHFCLTSHLYIPDV